MPYFSYSGYDAKGKQTKGTIEASSSVQAVERLTERGVVVVDVAVAEERKRAQAVRPLSLEAHIFFCRSLASYLKSGLPLADSLKIINTVRPLSDRSLISSYISYFALTSIPRVSSSNINKSTLRASQRERMTFC